LLFWIENDGFGCKNKYLLNISQHTTKLFNFASHNEPLLTHIMPSIKSTELWKKFIKNPKLAHFLHWYSNEAWESQQLAAIAKVYEVELTNILVRSLARIIYENKTLLPIRLYHAVKESTNGRDLEIILNLKPNKNLKFHCQAKRLYLDDGNPATATYDQLNHKHGHQLKLLISQSEQRAYPLYLLYNYSKLPQFDSNYGCTVLSATYLERQAIQTNLAKLRFQDLHPMAEPIDSFTKIKNKSDIHRMWGGTQGGDFYTDAEIFDANKSWSECCPPKDATRTGPVPIFDLSQLSRLNGVETRIFTPKYRIVITPEPIFHRDFNLNL
jgi:hypothetical protein